MRAKKGERFASLLNIHGGDIRVVQTHLAMFYIMSILSRTWNKEIVLIGWFFSLLNLQSTNLSIPLSEFLYDCIIGKLLDLLLNNEFWGTYKVRNEIETKRNETKRNEINENETKRNEINKNETKRNEINEMKTK